MSLLTGTQLMSINAISSNKRMLKTTILVHEWFLIQKITFCLSKLKVG
jgi:hypothetical protein